MSSIRPTVPATRILRPRRMRILAAFILITALLVPLALLFMQFWASTNEDESIAVDERSGVAYLRPTLSLLGALDEAQAAAVRGQGVDVQKIRASMTAMDDVDRQQGAGLNVQDRWSELRAKIDGVLGRTVAAGRPAFEAYAEPIDLLVTLALKVGDESQLILDPRIDSYYLMDTALLRLPPVIVDAGRAADLPLIIAPPAKSEAQPVEAVQVAAAKDRVAREFRAIDSGLKKSFDITASQTLGQNLLSQLDAFSSPVRTLSPSAVLADPPPARNDPAGTAATRAELRRAALALGTVTLDELDKLLLGRQTDFGAQKIRALAAIIAGAVIASAILWLRLPTEPVAAVPESEPSDAPDDEPPAGGEPVYPVERDLVDARQLLAESELVHVGRALRSPSRTERPYDDR